MFDAITEKPSPRRWQTAVIIGSAFAHAAVLGVVVVGAMWKIEKLDLQNSMDITFRVPPPPGESSPPPAAEKLAVKTATPPKIVKIKPDVIVQPPTITEPPDVTTGGGGGDATTGGGGTGTDPEATGTCEGPDCIEGIKSDPQPDPEPVVAKKPPVVPPHVAKGLRVSGNDQIFPPELVRVEMLHQGKDTVQATVQLCVSAQGQVDSVRFLKRTGFKAYDDTLAREMREWRYKPYRVDGVPSPMCTVAVVIYRMRK